MATAKKNVTETSKRKSRSKGKIVLNMKMLPSGVIMSTMSTQPDVTDEDYKKFAAQLELLHETMLTTLKT